MRKPSEVSVVTVANRLDPLNSSISRDGGCEISAESRRPVLFVRSYNNIRADKCFSLKLGRAMRPAPSLSKCTMNHEETPESLFATRFGRLIIATSAAPAPVVGLGLSFLYHEGVICPIFLKPDICNLF